MIGCHFTNDAFKAPLSSLRISFKRWLHFQSHFRPPMTSELFDQHSPVILVSILTRSFAYETIKDRLPLIVTRIVDFLARHRGTMAQDYGEVSSER
jgi:hypothetical protein